MKITDSTFNQDDIQLDKTLRPQKLGEFIGQEKIKKTLNISIKAAKQRGEVIDHILIYGPPGLGKTTLAHIISREMNTNIKVTSGPAIEKSGDLAAILTNLEEGDVLFIDEIHRLNKTIEEILYPSMEDYALDIMVGKGPSAKSIRIDIPRFTLIGATTKLSLLSSPLRDRFGDIWKLEYYTYEELKKIIQRSAKILNIYIDEQSALEIAKRSRRTPRIANRLLKKIRDYAQVIGNGNIDYDICMESFEHMDIDHLGLDVTDRQILKTIIEKFNGGPVGIGTIAATTGEEISTIENVYEPFLMQIGFLERTPRGRIATYQAYKHLGYEYNNEDNKLF